METVLRRENTASVERRPPLLPLMVVVTVAVLVRASINFGTALMPKTNGAYYLVQVRSLLQNGGLAFDDFPFVFWLEALMARLLFALKVGDLSDCIVLASKSIDSALPALTALPAFLMTLKWSRKNNGHLWSAIAVATFSVLYFPALVMTSDFQKNAVGLLWLMCCMYSLPQALQKRTWRTYAATVTFFILAGATHIGAFGVTLAYVTVFGIVFALLVPRQRRNLLLMATAGIVALTVVIVCLHFVEPKRAAKLMSLLVSPVRLFERPFIASVLFGPPGQAAPFDVPNLVIVNLIALAGIGALRKRWNDLDTPTISTAVTAVVMSLFLASPFIAQEKAPRFYLMAYIPAAVTLGFALTHLDNKRHRFALSAFAWVVTIVSALLTLGPVRATSIPEGSYAELHQLRSKVTDPERTLIIARHGLEWWAAWVLGTKVAQEFQVDPQDWKKYEGVLFLKQIAGPSPFGPSGPAGRRRLGGPGGMPFPEVRIPDDAQILFQGQFFLLAKSDSPPDFYPLPKPR